MVSDLSAMPAMSPPPGHISNFDNPETMHNLVFSVAVSNMAFVILVVGIRIYTKAIIVKDIRLEDYFVILATMGIIMWDSAFIHASFRGFSRHMWDIRAIDAPYFSLISYGAEISHAITNWAAKCSILFQLERLFCPDHSRNSSFWTIVALFFVNTAYHAAAFIAYMFQCTPREKAWNVLTPGKCIDVIALTVTSGSACLLLDLGILIVPIAAVWSLPLPLKKKLGVMAIFGVAIFTCAIAALGVVLRFIIFHEPDLTWILTKVGIWTMVEYGGTILVCCMPSFPRFYRHLKGLSREASSTPKLCKTSAARPMSESSSVESGTGGSYTSTPQPSPGSHHVYGIGVAVSTSEETLAYSGYNMVPPPQARVKPHTVAEEERASFV